MHIAISCSDLHSAGFSTRDNCDQRGLARSIWRRTFFSTQSLGHWKRLELAEQDCNVVALPCYAMALHLDPICQSNGQIL